MRICVLVFAAAMLTAAPALAQTDTATTTAPVETVAQEPEQTTPTTEAPAETTTTEAEPERVCRTFQRTESRLRTRRERICHTQAEWDQMARDSAALVQNARAPTPEN